MIDLASYVGEVVEVQWHDAWSLDPWTPLEALDIAPLPCRTYGIVAGFQEGTLAVCGTINAGGDVCGTLMIPEGMVSSIRVILERDSDDVQEQPPGSDRDDRPYGADSD
jgi:hypothetical protein